MKIKFTFIMATYNRAHLITGMLDSLINQTYKNWECIIVDDNSTDQTAEVVKSYTEKDTRFKYVLKPENLPKGIPASRNIAIDMAKGDYIIFVDDDDLLHYQLLEVLYDINIKHPFFSFIHYPKKSFNESQKEEVLKIINKKIDPREIIIQKINNENYSFLFTVLLDKIGFASCTVMWKKEILKENKFNHSLQYAEEKELYVRILLNSNISGIVIKQPYLYHNLKHVNSNTGEFWITKNNKRIESFLLAHKLIQTYLKKYNLINKDIWHYYTKLACQFKSPELLLSKKCLPLFYYQCLKKKIKKLFK